MEITPETILSSVLAVASAFVNKGAGGFVTINTENDTITLVEDTYTERGTFVKPATSYFNDVGVAATSGTAVEIVDVYVVG